jgi:hypothetical protein
MIRFAEHCDTRAKFEEEWDKRVAAPTRRARMTESCKHDTTHGAAL